MRLELEVNNIRRWFVHHVGVPTNAKRGFLNLEASTLTSLGREDRVVCLSVCPSDCVDCLQEHSVDLDQCLIETKASWGSFRIISQALWSAFNKNETGCLFPSLFC